MIYIVIILIGLSIYFILKHIFLSQKITLMKKDIVNKKFDNLSLDLNDTEEKTFAVQIMFVAGSKSLKSLSLILNDKEVFFESDANIKNRKVKWKLVTFDLTGTEQTICKKLLNTIKLVINTNSFKPIKAMLLNFEQKLS